MFKSAIFSNNKPHDLPFMVSFHFKYCYHNYCGCATHGLYYTYLMIWLPCHPSQWGLSQGYFQPVPDDKPR